MERNQPLASWLLSQRNQIEENLRAKLGPAAPRASGPEAETLRRFRTFVAATLTRGELAAPALEGLRPNERRVMSLLSAWADSAAQLAGPDSAALHRILKPLLDEFRLALRTSSSGRRSRASKSGPRRVVAGAIDRVADAFLAIDVAAGTIVDANPAAGALLGVTRDALLGLEWTAFVPKEDHDSWWSQLDCIAESSESLRFRARLQDVSGVSVAVETHATAFSTRSKSLALIVARRPVENLSPLETRAEVADSPILGEHSGATSKPGSP